MNVGLFKIVTTILNQNKFFFGLFLVWLFVGGIMQVIYSPEVLFFMVNDHFTTWMDYVMVILSAYGRGDCIPFILGSLLIHPAFQTTHYLVVTAGSGLFLTLVSYVAKQFYGCARPLVEYGLQRVHTVAWMDNAYNNSFPSGHTMGAFGLFLVLTFYLPNRLKTWSILFFFLALGCGISRLYLGQHYFRDIYYGSIFGVLIATFFYTLAEIYLKPKMKN